LQKTLTAGDWKSRERHLSIVYSAIARAHNKLGITGAMPIKTSNYFSRPYKVIHADAFADAIRKRIRSSAVRSLTPHIGSVDQFVDNTDVLSDMELCRELCVVYRS